MDTYQGTLPEAVLPPSIGKLDLLAAALSKVQAEMQPARQSGKNPHFKSAYSTLTDVWDACRPLLAKNGLSIAQVPSVSPEGKLYLRTILMHCSGQSIIGIYPVKPTKDDPQGLGSALTYARRYSLSAMIGVVVEDDDGNAASAPGNNTRSSAPAPSDSGKEKRKPKFLTEKQMSRLFAIVNAHRWPHDEVKELIRGKFGLESSLDLNREQYDALIDHIEKNPVEPEPSDAVDDFGRSGY